MKGTRVLLSRASIAAAPCTQISDISCCHPTPRYPAAVPPRVVRRFPTRNSAATGRSAYGRINFRSRPLTRPSRVADIDVGAVEEEEPVAEAAAETTEVTETEEVAGDVEGEAEGEAAAADEVVEDDGFVDDADVTLMPFSDVWEVEDFDVSQLDEDSIMLVFEAEGTMSELNGVGTIVKTLEGVQGVRDIDVKEVEGHMTVQCKALTSIQNQEKSVHILEAMIDAGFQPLSMRVGFADIQVVDENSPPIDAVQIPTW